MAEDPAPSPPNPETPPPRTTGGNWRWEPPSPEELQALMPGYTIEKVLGRGGMGAVYRGVQTNLDRTVAIKILPPGVEKEDPSFAERFKSEARLMAKLNHPAVVAVYDFGTTLGGQLYFAMEYVDGSDVSQMIAAQGRLPPEHALAITAHVCDALAAAHELGIVHRDIKPANVLLNMKGQVKVADFGLAKVEEPGSHGLTKTGYAMGTPDFVAPEALTLGTAIDGRADLYAVGVMLYQMLTGNIPRGAWQPASVLVPGVDRRFDAIITKAMQYDREHRHRDATELRRELDVIMTVPLVQQDAPAMAAIPVAQVAEAPGQRSAIQKPVGRPPQGGAGTSARRSTPGGAAAKVPEAKVHAPAAEAKSKAPLFIGIVAAAAIAIGAFVMFGGKKDAKPAQPNVQATATTTSSKPTPLKPAKPPQTTPAQQPPSKPQPSTPTSTAPKTAPSVPIADLPAPDGKPADLSKPVKVFILLGSSEMMGYGKIVGIDKAGTLENAVRKQRLYPFLADDSGKWTERMDVRSVSVMRMSKGDGMDVLINDWLRITGTDIGPEISLGHKLGNALDEPVLLLKSCNGNRSLGWDLLPPGSKGFEFSENGTNWIYAGYKESPNRWAKGTAPKRLDWHAGKQYDYDIGYAKAVLADLGKYYPGAKKHEIAGFFFWQGGRDLGDAGHVSRYEQNLVQMIEQVRRDFNAPNAPFVCATLGEARKGDSGRDGQVLAAQLAVDGGSGKYPQFKGNVATVYSNPLSQGGTASSHYDGNAQTFMDVGLGMGDAMVRLLRTASPAASGAALPIPASSDKFPPGQWVKVFTKFEDLPAQFQKTGSGVRLNDGKLEVDSISTYLGLALAAGNMSNCAVRATMLADDLNLSLRGEVLGKVSYLFKTTSIEVGRPATDGRPADFPRLASFSAPPKTEQQWEFGAVGNSLITRRGGVIIGFATDARIKIGMPVLANFQGTLRDIEVINLDGLSEAEALKILGVDKKGNDLRKSAVAATSTPAPAGSSSPSLPVPARNASRSDAGGARLPTRSSLPASG